MTTTSEKLAALEADLPKLLAEYGPDHVMDAFAARADDIVDNLATEDEFRSVMDRIDAMLEAHGLGGLRD